MDPRDADAGHRPTRLALVHHRDGIERSGLQVVAPDTVLRTADGTGGGEALEEEEVPAAVTDAVEEEIAAEPDMSWRRPASGVEDEKGTRGQPPVSVSLAARHGQPVTVGRQTLQDGTLEGGHLVVAVELPREHVGSGPRVDDAQH